MSSLGYVSEMFLESYNCIFALKFKDSQEDFIAHIPLHSAGPRGLLTKSEVATMDFI